MTIHDGFSPARPSKRSDPGPVGEGPGRGSRLPGGGARQEVRAAEKDESGSGGVHISCSPQRNSSAISAGGTGISWRWISPSTM